MKSPKRQVCRPKSDSNRRLPSIPCAALATLVALTNISIFAAQPSPVVLGLEVVSRLLFAPREPVRLILGGEVSEVLEAVRTHGLPIHRILDRYVVVSASTAQTAALLSIPAITSIAGDVNVAPMMVVSDRAMGADQARSGGSGLLGLAFSGVTGNGVGVAIVDSGISPHRALANKVVANVSFVPGDSAATDAYGHGTHIAGIVAGLGSAATRVTPAYGGGVAPGAHLVNLRVLGPNGSGYTSNVIAGLDWVIANQRRYSIRIVNLSLGHPVTAPCVLDPLCSSIQRVVQAGIVVVASAGNRGMTSSSDVFGTITSPGNSPAAITVGALNTFGTVVRTDDGITTYSSRGPTPYDMGVKPDLVAPGNKIVSLEAADSYLARTYSSQHVAGSATNAYYRMSGTSMAAAMVSGGLALLFEASPGLTTLHAKLALQLTASPMDEGLMAGGAGSVNLWGARRLVSNPLTGALPTTTISGVVARAGGMAFIDHGTLAQRLHTRAGMLALPAIGSLDTMFRSVTSGLLYKVGLQNPLNATPPLQMLWGDQLYGADGQQMLWGDQLLWGDQIFDAHGQQMLWGDQLLWGDRAAAQQMLWGDQQSDGQQMLWGDSLVGGDPPR